MRRSFLLFILVVAGCTNSTLSDSQSNQDLRSLNSGFGTVLSVQPVHVKEGFPVWRQGTRNLTHDGLLIRVDNVESASFRQTAASSPLFVLNDTIVLTLAQPFGDDKQALILTHSPPAGTQATLWMTGKGELPTRLVGEVLRSTRKKALSASAQNGINIQVPPDSVAREVYTTYADLRSAAFNFKGSRQFCAKLGKECGVVSDLQIGTMDCGDCPDGQQCGTANLCCSLSICQSTGRQCGPPSVEGCEGFSCGTCTSGQVCTSEGLCCRPETCSSLGVRCGSASDGCGGMLDCGFCPASKKK